MGAGIKILHRNCLFDTTETFRRGTVLCLKKIFGIENVRDTTTGREIEGASQFSAANFLSHSAENTYMGTL